jgi:ribose 1,5-bisphosphokinase
MTKIVLIVGPSGAGKDTLLRNIKDKIDANIIKRYITRKPTPDESNYFLDIEAFEILEKNGFFISTWRAHNNRYGIPKNQIKDGLNIISISRGTIKNFEEKDKNVTTIEVTVPKEILYERLKKRGREGEENIKKRLNRSYDKIEAKRLITFQNVKPIDESVKDFINILKGV